MAKPKHKKINRHQKKNMSMRRLTQLLKQHLFDTGMMTSYVDPVYTETEVAQAKFVTSEITSQLAKSYDPRMANLIKVMVYQWGVQGVINYLSSGPTVPRQDVTKVGPTEYDTKVYETLDQVSDMICQHTSAYYKEDKPCMACGEIKPHDGEGN